MKSYEVLREAVNDVGVKSVAGDMKLSPSLIYRWCEPTELDSASGANNPLDRVAKIYELTGNVAPIKWICEQADGFFVQNSTRKGEFAQPVFEATQRMLKEFSDVLQAVNNGMADDGGIDHSEAATLRREWEQLKTVAEGFIVSCEQGEYRKDAYCGQAKERKLNEQEETT